MLDYNREYPVNAFRLCIDGCEADLIGEAYSPLSDEPVLYKGFAELLLKMDKIFDMAGYPQAFQEKRSFKKKKTVAASYRGIPKAGELQNQIWTKKGKMVTLDIVIVERRNSSWQGEIHRTDMEEMTVFRGEIELFGYINQMFLK